MREFFKAFVYFMENGLPEKLAKDLAEKVTGVKAPTGKIEIPKTKGPDEFQMPKAKDDVIEASDNVSGNYAAGDTKYNADVLATELARKRGFIEDDGIQDATDMDQTEYSKLYSEAYEFLSNLNRLNKPVARVETPKKLATKKERGELVFVNSKMSNPAKSKMVLQGLDGTTESLYSQLRIEQEALKNGMEKNLKYILDNNVALGQKDKDNLLYNAKMYNDLTKKVNKLADDLTNDGKEPEKIYQNYRDTQLKSRFNLTRDDIAKQLDRDKGILESMDESMEKIKKLLDEMEDIKSGKAEIDNETRVRNLYQGKGYGPNEALFRSLSRQFLKDEIEAGRIQVTPRIYDAMKKGNHPFIDPIKVFRHHYGDDAFDKLENFIDENAFSDSGIRYPGRFEFRKMGLVVKNKTAPGKTYEHYSLPGEIDQQIADVDKVIKTIEEGNNPFFKTKEDIKNQNSKRANLVKIRNEIAPEDTKVQPGDELLETADTIDLSQYTNKMLNDLAEEGNKLQDELAQLDETGSSKLPYKEFQQKSKRLEQIAKILEEAQKKPEDFFPDDTAEIIPIKQEGIISNLDLNVDRTKTKFNNVELYGDETFDELKYIEEYGVHPRDLDPKDGFARGGIVEVLI